MNKQLIKSLIILVFIFILECRQVFAERGKVAELCNSISLLDISIQKALTDLPKNEGENLIKNLTEYNSGLEKLEDMLISQRQEILTCEEAVVMLKEGAPEYFRVNIDRNTTMSQFGWQPQQMDRVWRLRSGSIEIWTRLNRRSRLIPLEYYTYPENETYIGYRNPAFPPLKEKMTN